MAERQAQQRVGVLSDVEDWVARRRADVDRFGRDAEAAAHEALRVAARTGQAISAAKPSDVVALGARLLDQPQSMMRPPSPKAAGPAAKPPRGADWRDKTARSIGGAAAQTAGNVAGVFRGARNTAKDLGDSAVFVARLANPYEAATAPLGETAWDELFGAASDLRTHAADRAAHPEALRADVVGTLRKVRTDVDPTATRSAESLPDELKRRFEVGKNQGELAFDVGSTLYGAGELKALSKLNFLSEEARTANALKRATRLANGDPRLAQNFMEPYEGMGHHVIGRKQSMPAYLGGGLYPKAIVESPLFVIDGQGMRKGEFLERHVGVDDDYYGGKIPARYGGGTWSGEKLGWTKYGPSKKAWFGTTKPMKMVVGAGVLGAGALGYDVLEGEYPQ